MRSRRARAPKPNFSRSIRTWSSARRSGRGSSLPVRSGWKRPSGASDIWSRASPITRSTCSIPRATSSTGIPEPNGSRATPARKSSGGIFRLSIPRRIDARSSVQIALRSALESGKYEAEGWRVRKDGSRFWAGVVINAIQGPDGSAYRICQDYARPHRAARRRRARAAGAEDGSHRPTHRRRRPRLQQSPDGHHRQS